MGTIDEVKKLPDNLILFDGVCNLCNASVNFVIDRDPQAKFSFASLQSEAGQLLLTHCGMDVEALESVMLWKQGKLYTKSRAALEIARGLSGAWPVLYIFRLVPRFIRDSVYNFIASHRYKWFGKSDQCRMPAPGIRKRFIADGALA